MCDAQPFTGQWLLQAHLPSNHPSTASLDRKDLQKVMQRRAAARSNIIDGRPCVRIDLPKSKGKVQCVAYSKCSNHVLIVSTSEQHTGQVMLCAVEDGKVEWQKPFDSSLVQGNLQPWTNDPQQWTFAQDCHFLDCHFGSDTIKLLSLFWGMDDYFHGCMTLVHLDRHTGDKLQHFTLDLGGLHADFVFIVAMGIHETTFSSSGALLAFSMEVECNGDLSDDDDGGDDEDNLIPLPKNCSDGAQAFEMQEYITTHLDAELQIKGKWLCVIDTATGAVKSFTMCHLARYSICFACQDAVLVILDREAGHFSIMKLDAGHIVQFSKQSHIDRIFLNRTGMILACNKHFPVPSNQSLSSSFDDDYEQVNTATFFDTGSGQALLENKDCSAIDFVSGRDCNKAVLMHSSFMALQV